MSMITAVSRIFGALTWTEYDPASPYVEFRETQAGRRMLTAVRGHRPKVAAPTPPPPGGPDAARGPVYGISTGGGGWLGPPVLR